MWKLNNILLTVYGIIPGQVEGEGIAVKGIFDLPKRLGITFMDWDDQDSVQPYVDADEIFLEGRDITFSGILTGTKADTELDIEFLKYDVSLYNNLVPFETPYGTFYVYVKKITSKIYNGIATVLIEFREPSIEVTSVVVNPGTIYYSAIYNETAIKNNCGVGYHGEEVSLASTLGQFTSTISQVAANQLAIDWVRENKQNHANAGSEVTYCTINNPMRYNTELTNSRQKDNCGVGYAGSIVSHTIAADLYSSDSSADAAVNQAAANAKAQAAMDLILTQAYANENGTCSIEATFKKTYDGLVTYFYTTRDQVFQVGQIVTPGTIYHFVLYGIELTYTAISGDNTQNVVNSFVTQINALTETNWRVNNQAPISVFTAGFKPFASSSIAFSPLVPDKLIVSMPVSANAEVWVT